MKYQWHNIEWQISPENLKEAILNEPYSEISGRGFKLDSFIRDKLDGRYILKKTYTEEVTTPLGKKELLDRVQYVTYQFEINTQKKLSLVIKNPPRSASDIGSAFARITNHQVTFFPLSANLKKAIELLCQNLNGVQLKKLSVINVPFEKGNVGTVTLRGADDLFKLINNHPEISKGKITKVEFTFFHDELIKSASLSHQGVLVCDESVAKHLKTVFYDILTKLIS